MRIIRNIRQNTQLNLRIVRRNDRITLRRSKRPTNIAGHCRFNGDILQIRLHAGQPPRRGRGLQKRCMDHPLTYQVPDPVHIRSFELGKRTVFHDIRDDRMLIFQFFQHLYVCGISRFRLFDDRQGKLFKQHLRKLLGRTDIKLRSCQLVDTLRKLCDLRVILQAEGF